MSNIVFEKNRVVLIAGPCAIESEEQFNNSIKNLEKVDAYRGGAYKVRTSPYDFSGLKNEGIDIIFKASKQKPVVSEITDKDLIPLYSEKIDVIQVGARNMQNIELLKALGKTNKQILLKRGFGNTVDEFLEAAEYIKKEGNNNIILCERGIRTFETSTRFTLDLASIAVIKSKSSYPVVVDPSHAAGNKDFVESLALAAVAAGADGLMIEVHENPDKAMSDKKQALTPEEYNNLIKKVEKVAKAIGKEI